MVVRLNWYNLLILFFYNLENVIMKYLGASLIKVA